MISQNLKHKLLKYSIIGVTTIILTSCGSTSNYTYRDGIYNDEPVIEVSDKDTKANLDTNEKKQEQVKNSPDSNTFTTELDRLNQLNGTTSEIDTSITNTDTLDEFNYKKTTDRNVSDINVHVYTQPDWRWRSSASLYGYNTSLHFHNWNYDHWYWNNWNNTYWYGNNWYPNNWNSNYYYRTSYDLYPYWSVGRNSFWSVHSYYYPRNRWGYRSRLRRSYINNNYNRKRSTGRRYSEERNNTYNRRTRGNSRIRQSSKRTYPRDSSTRTRTSRARRNSSRTSRSNDYSSQTNSRTSRRSRNTSKQTTRTSREDNNSSNRNRRRSRDYSRN